MDVKSNVTQLSFNSFVTLGTRKLLTIFIEYFSRIALDFLFSKMFY